MTRCDLCQRKAKVRVHAPISLHLCRRCCGRLEHDLRRKGVRTVHLPHGASNTEVRTTMVRELSEGCDVVVAWIARSQVEYERGCELGMIGGWSSWEVYEHEMRTILSAVEGVNLVMLDEHA